MNKAFKSIAFVAALTMGLLLPLSANAQYYKGSLLRDDHSNDWENSSLMNNRDAVNWTTTITTGGIGEPVPIGDGLLILTAAGLGYAALRRKRSRKNATLLLACVLLLGFTQCKKEESLAPADNNGKVRITLRLVGNTDSRAIVDPTGNGGQYNYAPVSLEAGDRIYVGYNNAYVGYLDYASNGSFTGDVTITETVDGEPLHFYLLGGKGFNPVREGNTFTLDISDQTAQYPAILYAPSKEAYSTTATEYTSKLWSQCSIVKFNTTDLPMSNDVILVGMNNTVTVDLAAATDEQFSYSKTGDGEIKLHAESNTERWAVMLPQKAVTNTIAYATDYATQNPVTVPKIEMNQYKPEGITLTLSSTLISVSANDKARFAPGNLQYLGNANGTGTWRFAEHQYDFMGDGPSSGTNYQGNVTVTGYDKYNASADLDVARDLFGWGTSGYNDKFPYMTSNSSDSYYRGSITGTDYDWGVYHRALGNSIEKITNGGNYAWRLFTGVEWAYAIARQGRVYTRPDVPTYSENKDLFAPATVMGVKGIIIFPDSWTGALNRSIEYGNASNYDKTICDDADTWAMYEKLGCVFLPAACVRNGAALNSLNEGHYWASTTDPSNYNNEYRGCCLEWGSTGTVIKSSSNCSVRRNGQSVRLIRIVE